MTVRVGLGFDVHPFASPADGRPLVLAGVTIPDGLGLAGHSDADVVAHAVADALLGAAGLPDLGTRYPASDDAHRGADSMQFLVDIAAELAGAGWVLGNVDVVIAAEMPRLAPHLDAMRASVARALAPLVGPGEAAVPVALSPKRAEGLGAIGRAEGIAAWSVVLLQRAASPPAPETDR